MRVLQATFVFGFLQRHDMGGQGMVLLDPAVHQALHSLHLLSCHPAGQIEVKAQALSLQDSALLSTTHNLL